MIFKQITDNIDKPFPIVIGKSFSFSFNLYARGYHAYINISNPVDGEILLCTREIDDFYDKYTVFIMRHSYVVGHVPMGLNKPFSNFLLLPGSVILCTATGKKINRMT